MKRKAVIQLAFRGFRYYLSEAVKNLWYNKIMAATSIVTVIGCLTLFGLFIIIGLNINNITYQVEDQCEIAAYLTLDCSNETAASILQQISLLPNVEYAFLETGREAFDNYKLSLGEKSVALEGIDPDKWLPPSIRITPKDISSMEELVGGLEKIEGVDDVVYSQDLITNISNATSEIRRICIIAAIILAIIAVFIISNTIKLDVHARQQEIHIMKYVGATDWFIRWPFIIEGIIVGILGALASIFITSLGSAAIVNSISAFFPFKFLAPGEMLSIITSVLAGFGVFMGALGSLIAVRKHLHV